MKVIANYLPQFHRIPENDKFWGEGFTDWVSCKKAVPLFEGHCQPKIPLNENYYSLDNIDSIRWQANLAKEYGISGFAIYHYWFHRGLNLLTKPAEIILENKDIDLEYFFLWDNNSWKKTWSALTGGASWTSDVSKKTEVMAELIYGDENEWKAHFEFLLPFFKDKRYIKKDGKPMFGLFNTYKNFEIIDKMYKYWDRLAKENGFNGICVLSREDYKQKQFEDRFIYTPFAPITWRDYIYQKMKRIVGKEKIKKYDYDYLWKRILKTSKKRKASTILSGFVDFDDSPRRGENGNVVIGANPTKFKQNLKELLKIAQNNGSEIVLLTAWNEWGEGCVLEPESKYGYGYLNAVKEALLEYVKE